MVYRLSRLLGRGSLAHVYISTDDVTRNKIVVKIIPLTELTAPRARREVEIPLLMKPHSNIIRPIRSYQDSNKMYILFDHHDNIVPLSQWNIPEIPSLLDVMIQLVETLIYIHQHRIAHRDIKLDNILIKDNVPMIIDWDLACVVDHPNLESSDFVGTPEYVAPEIWERRIGYDPFRADIYSLGVVFYYLCHRCLPHDYDLTDEIRRSVLSGTVKSNCGQPNLDLTINGMITLNPLNRLCLIQVREQLIKIK